MRRLGQIELFTYFRDPAFRQSALLGLFMMGMSLVINFYAGTYSTANVTNRVGDLIIDNFGPYNVNLIFEDGSVLLWFFVGAFLIARPKYIPAYTKSLTLFVLIRSGFIVLTHLAPPHEIVPVAGFFFSKFTFGGDLFFSGHTGGPYLMALVFWRNLRMRYIFLALSVVFATAALLGHKHYSIDVFAAYFITYSIYHIARYFFPADFELIDSPKTAHGTPESLHTT